MLNKAILAGRLTKEPELSVSPTGTKVTRFTLAINRRFNREETDFLNIVCFNNTAEFVKKYFTKGQAILVTGSIQTRSWDGQDGQKRYATDIVAEEVSFCGSKNENNTNNNAAPTQTKEEFMPIDTDDELPF